MAEVEVVASGIAGVNCKVPYSGGPVKRAVEVCCGAECPVLPVEQNVAEVEVALCPVCAVQVIVCVDAH